MKITSLPNHTTIGQLGFSFQFTRDTFRPFTADESVQLWSRLREEYEHAVNQFVLATHATGEGTYRHEGVLVCTSDEDLTASQTGTSDPGTSDPDVPQCLYSHPNFTYHEYILVSNASPKGPWVIRMYESHTSQLIFSTDRVSDDAVTRGWRYGRKLDLNDQDDIIIPAGDYESRMIYEMLLARKEGK